MHAPVRARRGVRLESRRYTATLPPDTPADARPDLPEPGTGKTTRGRDPRIRQATPNVPPPSAPSSANGPVLSVGAQARVMSRPRAVTAQITAMSRAMMRMDQTGVCGSHAKLAIALMEAAMTATVRAQTAPL
jgi:hypothetical protein